ncbi:MAG: ABC transporter substrate-binding protein [Cycloclasticus sp.]|mgnify:CR=1 FL=1
MLKNRPLLFSAGLLLCMLALSFCLIALSDKVTLLPGTKLGNSEVLELDPQQKFPRQIIDPIGRAINLPAPPVSVVSGVLASDEMLSKLLEPTRVSSVTDLVDDPGISNVAGFYPRTVLRNHGSIEEFIAAEPDLAVVAAYSNATSVELLLATGIPLIRFANYHSYDDLRSNVRTLAKALGSEKRAERWLVELDSRIDVVQQRIAGKTKPRVLSYSMSGSTAGPGSLTDETIRLAGGVNVISELGLKGYTKISPEVAISLLPDVILVNDWSTKKGPSARDILLNHPAWQDVPAVKNKRIYSIQGAWVTSVTPYRVKGIEQVAHLLHPSIFSANDSPQAEAANHQTSL